MVGREADLERLQGWFRQALGGTRQFIFVTGEAGIGKTTLVDRFLDQVATQAGCWLARGQCVEHYGAGEAYLPVLEAIEQLCGEPAHRRVVELLQQQAPTWLVQMPWLLSAAELEGLQHRVQGASRERMLWEMTVMLEVLTAEIPLVLTLEDLHWSDYATLDLIAWLARRREPARLLVIGTYRPVDVIVRGHPLKTLKQELQMHRQCEEVLLDLLPEADVARYLAARFGSGTAPTASLQTLAHAIYQRTDGHPFFMVTVADDAVRRGWLSGVKRTLGGARGGAGNHP
jgi:predicted ATPase